MSFQIYSVPEQYKIKDSSVEPVRGDLQGTKGPTEHLGASLLLVIPTSVQLGDTWILKTVASRFQVVRFVSISRIQVSLLLCMRDSLLWSCQSCSCCQAV